MSIFLIKSILALIFFSSALGASLSMLTLMGRQNRKIKPPTLKQLHKFNGYIFFILLLVISFICIRYVAGAGDHLSSRAVAHSLLSLFLIILFFIKMMIVRFYKQFLKYAPVLGLIVLTLAFVVTATSAGFYFLRPVNSSPLQADDSAFLEKGIKASAENGSLLFQNKCGFCHHADRDENKSGPGLKGLLKKDKLPFSGRPATLENVRNQLINPVSFMPSFKDLSDQEIADLLAYLEII